MRILWVGPVLHERHFANPAVSAAASVWQQGLIHSILERAYPNPDNLDAGAKSLGQKGPSNSIEYISHLPCQSFPKGALLPHSDAGLFTEGFVGYEVQYCNLPFLRDWELAHRYDRLIGRVLAANCNQPFDLLVSYNAESYVSASVAKWAKKQSLPWISIIADLPRYRPQEFLDQAKVADADGRLFLSWQNYQAFGRLDRDLFLEGGVSFFQKKNTVAETASFSFNLNCESTHKKRIAYFGGLTTLGGIDLFMQTTHQLRGSEYEFHIIGIGDAKTVSRIQSLTQLDSRIYYHGPVPEQELMYLGKQMDIFIDPRPKDLSENNFPSKLLTYLRFSKPIISTVGHGIPPEYNTVLIHLEKEDPMALAQLIERVCDWDRVRASEHQQLVSQFVIEKKSWVAQGRRAGEWMHTIMQNYRKKK